LRQWAALTTPERFVLEPEPCYIASPRNPVLPTENTMSNNAKWLWLTTLAFLLTACGGDDDDKDNSEDAPKAVIVKVVPVSANAPLVSVLMDTRLDDDQVGSTPAGDQSFGQAVSLSTLSGTHEYTFRYALPKSVGRDYNYPAFIEKFQFKLEGDKRYEFYVGGEYPDGEYWTVEMPLAFAERESQARLTLVNASTNVTAVDFHLTKAGEPIDSASLLSSLNYKESDASVRVAPGTYQLQITASDSTDVIYTSPSFTLSKGSDLSLAAIDNAWIKDGVVDKSPLVVSRSSNTQSSLLFDESAGADLRVIHASPDAGPLDVVIDDNFDQLVAEDLELGQVSNRHTTSGGPHNLKAVPANGATAAIDANYNLVGGVAWAMYILRPWESIDPLFVSENARDIDGQARLRFVMGSTGTGSLAIWVTEEGADIRETEKDDNGDEVLVHQPLGSNMSFRTVSTYTPTAPGTYDITFGQFNRIGELVTIYGPVTATLAGGEVYTLLLRDNADMATQSHEWLDDVPVEEASEEDADNTGS
jgi:hypothetical protein